MLKTATYRRDIISIMQTSGYLFYFNNFAKYAERS